MESKPYIKPICNIGSYSTFGKMTGGKWQEFVSETEYEEALEEDSVFQQILNEKKGGIANENICRDRRSM